ncbi:MAG: DUF4959 domain-containing protein [Tannerella sp.]|jgi:hypothetical protein|nr:DUF4959 domain-containing protein [Tannerella sp.]
MKRIYFYLVAVAVLCFSCKDAEMAPVSGSSGKPEKVEILAMDSIIPGGIVINYKIPPINDIIEIKAVYTLTNGQKRESSTSFYTSYMTIDGYNDTGEHEAEIYTINRAREMSDPVSVKFRPGESALSKATSSMQIVSDFGGVSFRWRNPDRAALIFEFYTENEQGEMITMDIMSSKTDSTDVPFYGYDTIPYRFAVNIRDNFDNSSGMIYPENGYVVPLYEIQLDKKIQKAMVVAGDVTWDHWEGRLAALVDDDIMSVIHSDNNTTPGASVTLDLGKKAKLSRFKFFQRQHDDYLLYTSGNFQIFEVYSSDEEGDSPDGDWSAWTLRKVCTITKPSGSSSTTDEDIVAARQGHDFSLPFDMPPVRYLRFKVLKIWQSGYTFSYIAEINTYGVYAE